MRQSRNWAARLDGDSPGHIQGSVQSRRLRRRSPYAFGVISSGKPLPFAVRQAVIQACGTVFYWKSGLVQLFVSSGVPEPAVSRYVDQGLAKFKIARAVLDDLDRRGAAGHRVQWQVVDSLLELNGPADNDADLKAANAALATLRDAVGPHRAPPNTADAESTGRKKRSELQRLARERQAEVMAGLRTRFLELENERDTRKRGFAFERFLADLFRAFGIEYRSSYRAGVEQIDGAFNFGGRDYLVEARWRKLAPDANDLFDFAMKVSGKLDGTLGLVISMLAPAPRILEHVSKQSRRVLIMDGRDLALILEGQVTLPDAIEMKSRRAAQEGVLFASLAPR